MGYMTVVSILNDGWDIMKKNPDIFIENIQKGMSGNYRSSSVQHYPVKGYCNPMEVRRSFHADQSVLVMVGQNHMEDVSDFDPNRNNDFYLAYKARMLSAVEDKVEYAYQQLAEKISSLAITEMIRRKLDTTPVLEVQEEFEAYQALPKNKKSNVFKMTEKAFSRMEGDVK